jgi:hypothetical protein
MRFCAEDCRCILCNVDEMIEHPAFKARLQLLLDEFQHDTVDNQEWIVWKEKYKGWNADTLDTCGVRRGDHYVWVLRDHPVMDLVSCNVGNLSINVTSSVWQELDSALFDCCCQTLRTRFDFLKQGANVATLGSVS